MTLVTFPVKRRIIKQQLHGQLGSTGRSRKTEKKFGSLAILPFRNEGGGDTEYLSDGITETIINTLASLPKLRVMARSTVFRYKGEEVDPQLIGRQLNVNSVLTGRVILHGDTLNVVTELVDVSNGWHLWGEQYNRKLSDIFSVQESIAREISNKLKLKLTGDEKKRLAKRHTASADAYKLYLRGRYCWNKRGEAQTRNAMSYFNEAIAADPNYAMAYAGLADCYATLTFLFGEPPVAAMPKAREAANTALQIDERVAEAHASLGMVAARYDWDLSEAEREYQRAIALNPGYSVAHQWYGECLAAMQRYDEAIEQGKLAHELDPLSALVNSVFGGMYYFARRYREAINQVEKVLELEQDFWIALFFYGLSYAQLGEFGKAVEGLQRGVAASGHNFPMMAALGYVLGLAGRHEEARKLLDCLRQPATAQYVAPVYSALIAIGLKDNDVALTELERAADERSGWLTFLDADPRFDPLRSQPRFQRLLRRVGLQP